MIYSDKTLAQKLERAEARANADFIETRAKFEPHSGASWIEVAGAYAMFDGPGSPCTQTFGLGLFDELNGDHLDEIEDFFRTRGAPVFHEISPLADPSVITLLSSRNYRPVEMTSVMYLELDKFRVPSEEDRLKAGLKTGLETRIVAESEADLWAATSAAGWSTEMEGLAEFMLGFGRISARCRGAYPFLAELDGEAVSTGMLFICDAVCLLVGASTMPDYRNRGAQNALLSARLDFARGRGCKLATMGALPGSQSQNNAEKHGFRIAYTRTKWHLLA